MNVQYNFCAKNVKFKSYFAQYPVQVIDYTSIYFMFDSKKDKIVSH